MLLPDVLTDGAPDPALVGDPVPVWTETVRAVVSHGAALPVASWQDEEDDAFPDNDDEIEYDADTDELFDDEGEDDFDDDEVFDCEEDDEDDDED